MSAQHIPGSCNTNLCVLPCFSTRYATRWGQNYRQKVTLPVPERFLWHQLNSNMPGMKSLPRAFSSSFENRKTGLFTHKSVVERQHPCLAGAVVEMHAIDL